jgi:methylated-DNA-protein-cysteine methyltransferase related protein
VKSLSNNFKQNVLSIIAAIPRGKVMSYGQVAAAAGSPRAARQVGGILRHYDGNDSLPWWRVVNSAGHISIKGNFEATPSRQKQLLEEEGIPVSREYSLDIGKYRFYPPM